MPACVPWKTRRNISQRFPFHKIFINFAQLIEFLSSIKLCTYKQKSGRKNLFMCAAHNHTHGLISLIFRSVDADDSLCLRANRLSPLCFELNCNLIVRRVCVRVCNMYTARVRVRCVGTFEIANFRVQFALLRVSFFFCFCSISFHMAWPMDPNLISFRIFVRSMCGCWFDIATAAVAAAVVLQPLPFFVLGFDFYFRSFGCCNNNNNNWNTCRNYSHL